MEKRCSQKGQLGTAASSTTPLPPLLLKGNKSLCLCLIHHPRPSTHSRAFALSRVRRVAKLSSLLPKWVNVYLQLAGAGSNAGYAEYSPIAVCTGEPWPPCCLQRRFRLLLTLLFPVKLCRAHAVEVRISKSMQVNKDSRMDSVHLS